MEFKVVQKEIEVQSRGWIPTFHDISREVNKIVEASGIKNGTVAIVSHHTTCSVMVPRILRALQTVKRLRKKNASGSMPICRWNSVSLKKR